MKLFYILQIFYFCAFYSTQAKNACKNLSDYPTKDINPNCYENPDVGASTEEIIKNHGFQSETYTVKTPDGYELKIFRIPADGQPILFYAGLWCDTTTHVLIGDRSLGLSFAREGYDVYLCDYRGTIASRGHEQYTPDQKEYWNFTMDDVVNNDYPTLLQKVAEISGRGGDIIHLGHARGFFLALMYLCNNPNETLLRGVVGTSPAGYQDLALPMDIFIRFIGPVLTKIAPLFRVYALFQNPELLNKVSTAICPLVPDLCNFVYYVISGQSEQFLAEDLLNFYSHVPTSLSMKEFEHEYQMAWTKRMQKYDYGSPEKNLEVYNQSEPPSYDLSTIKNHPVYFFYDTNDHIVTPEYVKKQYDDLGTDEKEMILVPEGDNEECGGAWGHLDFFMAKNMTNCLFNVMLEHFKTKLAPRNNQ